MEKVVSLNYPLIWSNIYCHLDVVSACQLRLACRLYCRLVDLEIRRKYNARAVLERFVDDWDIFRILLQEWDAAVFDEVPFEVFTAGHVRSNHLRVMVPAGSEWRVTSYFVGSCGYSEVEGQYLREGVSEPNKIGSYLERSRDSHDKAQVTVYGIGSTVKLGSCMGGYLGHYWDTSRACIITSQFAYCPFPRSLLERNVLVVLAQHLIFPGEWRNGYFFSDLFYGGVSLTELELDHRRVGDTFTWRIRHADRYSEEWSIGDDVERCTLITEIGGFCRDTPFD